MQEIWKEYRTKRIRFDISNFGNVRGHTINIINDRKYVGTKSLYHLVWNLFVGPVPEGYIIHHIDHNPLNDSLDNLKLMTRSEHISHHMKDKIVSEETKQKISIGNIGKHNPSDETRKRMSESHKGKNLSEERKQNISDSLKGIGKGKHWYNNSVINCFTFECPEGFVPGRIKKHKNNDA